MLQTLTTPRGETLSGTPWQVYPRPQMRRDSYINLNGEWDFAVSSGKPETFDMRITVPFCPESRLSGIGRHFEEGAPLWYRRRFLLPEGFRRERVLLHIGAADQIAEVFVNGQYLCRHEGGYASFCVDITEALAEENELVIRCIDDLHDQAFPYGKQVMNRGGMWYTPVSGIWQTVWLESVPDIYIEKLNIENHGASVTISTVPPLEGTVSVEQLGQFPLEHGQVTIAPENPHFWCPDDPYLYRFTVETAQDKVESYFAIRSLEIKKVGGYPRLCLNGKPYFFHGLLDQGYWPEGLLTAPAPESYADDILAMKRLGFNTLRKHIKVEPEEFYYQCDRLGMIVWQDMVNNGSYRYFRDTVLPTVGIQKRNDRRLHRDERSRNAFRQGAADTVNQLKNHPCICYWTIFNEGWGQFDSDRDLRMVPHAGRYPLYRRHLRLVPWKEHRCGQPPPVFRKTASDRRRSSPAGAIRVRRENMAGRGAHFQPRQDLRLRCLPDERSSERSGSGALPGIHCPRRGKGSVRRHLHPGQRRGG